MGNRRKLAATPVQPTPYVPAAGEHLGDLGTDRGVLDITFGWFGSDIRVNPGAGELELMDFLMEAEGIEVGDNASLAKSVPAMQAVYKFLKGQIHPDDWALFYDLAKTHRQNTMDLMNVAMVIVDKVAGFPTGPSDASGAGTASTSPKSKGGSSSSRVDLTRQALSMVPVTRPDLMEAYVAAAEARAAGG